MTTTTYKMKNKYPSNDQAKLKVLCDDLCDHIEDLLNHFHLDYRSSPKMISMSCPIHQGDNPGAINLYTQGESYRGNWKCRTHNCEKLFKGSILGFIRGILSTSKYNWSKDGDKTCSFQETIEFVTKFLKKDLSDIKISPLTKNKQQFSSAINNISTTTIKPNNKSATYATREVVKKNLVIPAPYFLNRGFSKEILDKYDVGFCDRPNREMSGRVVAPIYDNDHQFMIGCTGRSIFEKCSLCSCFHDPIQQCPADTSRYLYSKWKHSANFKSQNHLYNYWFAQEHTRKDGYVIIVESPGNVWRLEEAGIHHSVAIFGSSLSDRQKMMLDASGAMSIIILTDNDEAGKKAAEQITNKCQNTYKIIIPTISMNDVGDMSIQEIHTQITPYLQKVI